MRKNKKQLLFLHLIFPILLMVGCKSSKDYYFDKIKGTWEINEIYYNQKPYNDSLSLNVLFFEDEKFPVLTIPKTIEFERTTGIWGIETIDNVQYLRIETKNHRFNGLYRMNFFHNKKRGLLGVDLESDSMKIKAYKFPR
ncbi:hypothetical protein J0656_17320 [Muricauda ruestringensis]|uniref:Lipocalin-like domain-containing protein n=1 Tax=Flagellimonas aurea TaxID=2915619 RepID=A0ABS3GB38_9FLAO|nr:hypothetical protein [Allomuricauda aurea]MBO0355782.1 hypothetical protein [Allomuricauda aurea]|tara:strand:+ start:3204 stop:3623 length:420 start_codon:yes stop_codon:yes gene_type:complete